MRIPLQSPCMTSKSFQKSQHTVSRALRLNPTPFPGLLRLPNPPNLLSSSLCHFPPLHYNPITPNFPFPPDTHSCFHTGATIPLLRKFTPLLPSTWSTATFTHVLRDPDLCYLNKAFPGALRGGPGFFLYAKESQAKSSPPDFPWPMT